LYDPLVLQFSRYTIKGIYKLTDNEQKQKIDKFNNYGTLIAVYAFLLLVEYTENGTGYDVWDCIISLIVSLFGIYYIKENIYNKYFDRISKVFISLITASGIVILLRSLLYLLKIQDFSDSQIIIAILTLTTILSIILILKGTKK
jgi:multidrug transporter EmrE-like cation transporter